MRTRSLFLLPSALTLVLGLACGGSASKPAPQIEAPVPATTLAYQDPAGSGWRLVKDASSTSTRIVLNLVGPSGLKTRGVGFNLQAPATVKFGAFASGMPIQDTGVYELGTAGGTDPTEPLAITGGVKKGNLLSVGIYQKDRDQSAKDSGTALCQIAIVFDPAAQLAHGTAVSLGVLKAKAIPEDIGAVTDDLWTLDQKMRMTELSIAVGTLTAN
jgi:hypothetical protein